MIILVVNNSNYMDIINFWFPNDDYNIWWFKPNDDFDNYIYKNYYRKLIDYEYKHTNNCIDMLKDIILLDQFSRNMKRINYDIDVEYYTNEAYKLSLNWINNRYYLTENIKFTVFALMPLRHLNYNEKVIELLDEIDKINPKIVNNKIYQKFRFHSQRKINI